MISILTTAALMTAYVISQWFYDWTCFTRFTIRLESLHHIFHQFLANTNQVCLFFSLHLLIYCCAPNPVLWNFWWVFVEFLKSVYAVRWITLLKKHGNQVFTKLLRRFFVELLFVCPSKRLWRSKNSVWKPILVLQIIFAGSSTSELITVGCHLC